MPINTPQGPALHNKIPKNNDRSSLINICCEINKNIREGCWKLFSKATDKIKNKLANYRLANFTYRTPILLTLTFTGAGCIGLDEPQDTMEDFTNEDDGTDSGNDDDTTPDPTPQIYELSEEIYSTEMIWTAPQGAGAGNNFGKAYHSMSVWRDNYTYVIYVDDELKARITKISDDGTDITTNTIEDYPIPANGHHSFAIGIDNNGYLHIAGDMHNYPVANTEHLPSNYQDGKCMYWRSTEPFSITDFSWYGGGEDGDMPYGDSFSYMGFANDQLGNLYYYARTRTNYGNFTNKQVFTVSRYDSEIESWTAIGAEPSTQRRSAVTLYGNNNENGSGSYTRIHGWVAFDRLNTMMMAANVIEGDNNFDNPPHYATNALFLKSDDLGETAMLADGTPIDMPGNAEPGHPQQADVVYQNPDGALATYTSVTADRLGRPHVLLKKQDRDKNGYATGNTMVLIGWRDGNWINYGNPNGVIPTNQVRINTGPEGVMTIVYGSTMVRFFDPEEEIRTTSLPFSGIENVDRTYLQATGNIQGIANNGDNISLVRTTIILP